jgi:pimeloyl-ACP methyl ester carboxylesterase
MPKRRAQALPIQRRWAEIDGVPLAWEESGEGPPLVLIHGLSGSCRWWSRNVPDLSRHFHVYAIDLIGFGASRGHPKHRFVLAEAASILAAWMDQAGIGRAEVVGHSMGGCIAIDLAANFSDHVDHLVLVDPAILPHDATFWRSVANLTRSIRYTPMRFLPVMAADALRAGPATVIEATRQIHATDMRPRLAGIQSPTLVIWGDHDTLVPLGVGEEISSQIPDVMFAIFPGAGHLPMWDAPDNFNRTVTAFLNDEAGTSGAFGSQSIPTSSPPSEGHATS